MQARCDGGVAAWVVGCSGGGGHDGQVSGEIAIFLVAWAVPQAASPTGSVRTDTVACGGALAYSISLSL